MPSESKQSTGRHFVESFKLTRDKSNQLRKRLPRRGDRSKVLQRLVDMFLDGQITVTIPGRTL